MAQDGGATEQEARLRLVCRENERDEAPAALGILTVVALGRCVGCAGGLNVQLPF
jgi:hypothetical protein